jgi:hypothetical protein
MSPYAREVLAAAAVIGRSIDHRLLASVVRGAQEELLGVLRHAAEHHILVTARSGLAYRFRHALLREAIYEDALPGERLRLHRAIAQTLSERPELAGAELSASAELAHHWYAARELPSALVASVQAATDAARVHAHPEALRHLQRALELWDQVPDAAALSGTDRFGLLLRTADMCEHSGNEKLGIELTHEARRLVTSEPSRCAPRWPRRRSVACRPARDEPTMPSSIWLAPSGSCPSSRRRASGRRHSLPTAAC